MKKFKGTWRRSEEKGKHSSGALVYDDYAHHPTEIQTTLAGFRERFPDKKIVVAFQPHLYSRTQKHFGDFADSFTLADKVLLAPIYAAREKDEGVVSHHDLAEGMRRNRTEAESYASLDALYEEAVRSLSPDTLFLTMGAGDIYQVGDRLLA